MATKKKIAKPKKILSQKPHVLESPDSPQAFFKAKIKVIGIGGGGSSIVSEIGKSLHKATFLVTDTDARSQKKRPGIKNFLFGQNLTRGLGTGSNPDLGRQAADQEKEKIAKFFQDQDIVILIASLGGGFGSGATQVFADVARDFNGITFGIFTLPFKFEGKNKHATASKALKKLKNSLNVSLTISNEKIFNIIDNTVAITEAFSMVNKHLIDLLESLIDLIYSPGIINIDFADLRAILKSKGSQAFLNTAEASGKDRANKVIEKILRNPLYQHNNFKAEKILFNIAGGDNVSLVEVNAISNAISGLNPGAKIIFGISKNPKLRNKIKTTLLMTGPGAEFTVLDKKPLPKKAPVAQKVITVKKPVPIAKKFLALPSKKSKVRKTKIKPDKKVIKEAKVLKKPAKKPLSFPGISMPVFGSRVSQDNPVQLEVKKMEVSNSFSNNKKAIRRTALEIKKAEELEENKQTLQEKEWEIPAFLRLKK